MKSLRELHEEEQREAAWRDAAARFHRCMDQIDADRERTLRQLRRDWALLQFVLITVAVIAFAAIIFGPFLW